MKRILVIGLFAVALGFVGFATTSKTAVADGEPPCVRKSFKTKLVKNACKTGQKTATKAMKKFVKAVKKKKKEGGGKFSLTCNDCHDKLKPDYPTKSNALADFKEYEKLIK